MSVYVCLCVCVFVCVCFFVNCICVLQVNVPGSPDLSRINTSCFLLLVQSILVGSAIPLQHSIAGSGPSLSQRHLDLSTENGLAGSRVCAPSSSLRSIPCNCQLHFEGTSGCFPSLVLHKLKKKRNVSSGLDWNPQQQLPATNKYNLQTNIHTQTHKHTNIHTHANTHSYIQK